MKIATQERIATACLLAVITVLTGGVWWTAQLVNQARHDERHAEEIVLALVNLRHLTFEFAMHRHRRAARQWHEVARRVDGLVRERPHADAEQAGILESMRVRMARAHRYFAEFSSGDDQRRGLAGTAPSEFEAHVLSRLFRDQQDNLAAAALMAELADARSGAAQDRMGALVLAGLALTALVTIGISWLIRRQVLAPIARLQSAARRVAAGSRDFALENDGADEVGQLTRDVGDMTRSLARTLSQVERNNRELAALNGELEDLSYSVAHDLRTPLRAIDGFSKVLLEDYEGRLDDEGKDSLRRIRSASQRMGRLFDDLLTLGRATRAQLTVGRVDLSALAHETVARFRVASPGRHVVVEIAPGVIGHGGALLLRMVVENLLSNAWKFTEHTPAARIGFSAERIDGNLVCHVIDNGAGFDMAYAAMLFTPFQRLHGMTEFPGNGIGLATVKRIMDRHGGRIWADAVVGQGAAFHFALPLEPSTAAGYAEPELGALP